ncbi:MAG: DUF5320 domain-containing protein [Chloroflexota bacterium]
MPYRDGTGPLGQGSRTGRGFGNCVGQDGVGRLSGLGLGRRGAGRGLGRGFGVAPVQDSSWVEDQIQSIKSALQSISDRLDAMKKE